MPVLPEAHRYGRCIKFQVYRVGSTEKINHSKTSSASSLIEQYGDSYSLTIVGLGKLNYYLLNYYY